MLDLVVPARVDEPAVVGAAAPWPQRDPPGPGDAAARRGRRGRAARRPTARRPRPGSVHQADRRVDVGRQPGQRVGDEEALHAAPARSGRGEMALGRRMPQLGQPRCLAARSSARVRARTASSYIRAAEDARPRRPPAPRAGRRGSGPRGTDRAAAPAGTGCDRCSSGPVNGVAPARRGVRRDRVVTAQQPVVERRAVRGRRRARWRAGSPGPPVRANAAARCGPARWSTRHCSRPARPGHQSGRPGWRRCSASSGARPGRWCRSAPAWRRSGRT